MSDEKLWVVFRVSMHGKQGDAHSVCEQSEWDAMEAANPGCHTLIREGIPSESEAERLARAGSAALGVAKAAEQETARVARAKERGKAVTPTAARRSV